MNNYFLYQFLVVFIFFNSGALAMHQKENLEKCVICYEELGSEYNIMIPCKHMFHAPCIWRWANEITTCPCCRKNFSLVIAPEHIQKMKPSEVKDLICNCDEIVIPRADLQRLPDKNIQQALVLLGGVVVQNVSSKHHDFYFSSEEERDEDLEVQRRPSSRVELVKRAYYAPWAFFMFYSLYTWYKARDPLLFQIGLGLGIAMFLADVMYSE